MIILRNGPFFDGGGCDSLDQREFGNKANKAKTRAWRLQQAGEEKKSLGRLLNDSQEDILRDIKEGEDIIKDSNKVLKPGDLNYDTQREALRRSRRNSRRISMYDDPISAKMSYGNLNKGNAWDYAKYMDSKTESPYLKTLKDLNSKKNHGKGYMDVRAERAELKNMPGPNNISLSRVDPATGKLIVNQNEFQRRFNKLPIEKQALVEFNSIKNSKNLTNQQKAKDLRHLFGRLTNISEGIMLHEKGDKAREIVGEISKAANKAEDQVRRQEGRARYRERYGSVKRRLKPVSVAPELTPSTSGPTAAIPDKVVKDELNSLTRKTDPTLKQKRADYRKKISGSRMRFKSTSPTSSPEIPPTIEQPQKPINNTPPKSGNVPPKGGGTPKPTTPPPTTGSVGGKAPTPGFFKRNRRALLIGGGVAALGGAGLYGYKKYKDNKKNK